MPTLAKTDKPSNSTCSVPKDPYQMLRKHSLQHQKRIRRSESSQKLALSKTPLQQIQKEDFPYSRIFGQKFCWLLSHIQPANSFYNKKNEKIMAMRTEKIIINGHLLRILITFDYFYHKRLYRSAQFHIKTMNHKQNSPNINTISRFLKG